MGSSSKWYGAVLFSCMCFSSTVAVGQALLVNRSFETGTDPGDATVLPPGSKSIDGWIVVGGNISYVGGRWQHAQGLRSVGLACGGGISQTIETTLDQEYEVRFSMAGDPTAGPAVKSVVVSFGDERRVFTFDTTGRSLREMGWETRSYIFKAATRSASVTFLSPAAECSVPAVDNIRIAAVEICVGADPIGGVGVSTRVNPRQTLAGGNLQSGARRLGRC